MYAGPQPRQVPGLQNPRADSRSTSGTIPQRERARGLQGHGVPVLRLLVGLTPGPPDQYNTARFDSTENSPLILVD